MTSRNLSESALTTISHHGPADLSRHCDPDSRVLLDVPKHEQGEERCLEPRAAIVDHAKLSARAQHLQPVPTIGPDNHLSCSRLSVNSGSE